MSKRLLIVEEDEPTLQQLRQVLQAHGFEVVPIASAAEFQEQLARERPELIPRFDRLLPRELLRQAQALREVQNGVGARLNPLFSALSAMMAYTELLVEALESGSGEDAGHYNRLIEQSASELSRLIREISEIVSLKRSPASDPTEARRF